MMLPGTGESNHVRCEVGGEAGFGHHAIVNFGVYVHVPFCRHRCDYCAFATWTDRDHLVDRYLSACRRQITDALPDLPPVTSGFVGGGTPSRVPGRQLVEVLAAVPFVAGAELTIECN